MAVKFCQLKEDNVDVVYGIQRTSVGSFFEQISGHVYFWLIII